MRPRKGFVAVRYLGPFDRVEIAATALVVSRGETVELAEHLAARLLEQHDTWQPATAIPTVDAVADHQED
jgi:hypothetical protein